MNKIVLGLLLGAVLGAIDGGTAWFAPAVRPAIVGIIFGSTFKGLIAGVAAGIFARKVNSVPLGILFHSSGKYRRRVGGMGNATIWRAQYSDCTGALESGTVLTIQKHSQKEKNNESEFENIGWIDLRGVAGFCLGDASGR